MDAVKPLPEMPLVTSFSDLYDEMFWLRVQLLNLILSEKSCEWIAKRMSAAEGISLLIGIAKGLGSIPLDSEQKSSITKLITNLFKTTSYPSWGLDGMGQFITITRSTNSGFGQYAISLILEVALDYPILHSLALSVYHQFQLRDKVDEGTEKAFADIQGKMILEIPLFLSTSELHDQQPVPFDSKLVWEKITPSSKPFPLELLKQIAPIIVALSFHGFVFNGTSEWYNDILAHVLPKLTTRYLGHNIEKVNLEWKDGIRLVLHNEPSLNAMGLLILKVSDNQISFRQIIAKLVYIRKKQFLDYFFTLSKKLSGRISEKTVLVNSSIQTLEVFSAIADFEINSINPHRLVNRIPVPDANNIRGGLTAAQILNLKDFYHQFLKWDITDDESLSAKPFLPIPGIFNDAQHYIQVFEPKVNFAETFVINSMWRAK